MAVTNLDTGSFTNAAASYFSAPQQLNAQGLIIGHSHVVVEAIDSLASTKTTDPTKFAFFKGLNAAAVSGVLTADVTAGLPAGVYRLTSINAAANHQPVLVPIAQHGSTEDMIFFTVTDGASNSTGATNSTGTSTSLVSNPSSTSTGTKNGKNGNKGKRHALLRRDH